MTQGLSNGKAEFDIRSYVEYLVRGFQRAFEIVADGFRKAAVALGDAMYVLAEREYRKHNRHLPGSDRTVRGRKKRRRKTEMSDVWHMLGRGLGRGIARGIGSAVCSAGFRTSKIIADFLDLCIARIKNGR